MDRIEAKITPVTRYSIEVGGVTYDDMVKESEWEGLVKFSCNKGSVICSGATNDPLIAMMRKFGGDESYELSVLLASPGICAAAEESAKSEAAGVAVGTHGRGTGANGGSVERIE